MRGYLCWWAYYMRIPHTCQYAIIAYDNIMWGEGMYSRIRNLREDSDLTQKDVAMMLNVTQTTYSRYESGVLDIPSVSLIRLAGLHKTSIDYIVGITDEKEAYPRGK